MNGFVQNTLPVLDSVFERKLHWCYQRKQKGRSFIKSGTRQVHCCFLKMTLCLMLLYLLLFQPLVLQRFVLKPILSLSLVLHPLIVL